MHMVARSRAPAAEWQNNTRRWLHSLVLHERPLICIIDKRQSRRRHSNGTTSSTVARPEGPGGRSSASQHTIC